MIQQIRDRKGPHRRFSRGICRFEKKLFRVFNVFISPHFLFYSSGAKNCSLASDAKQATGYAGKQQAVSTDAPSHFRTNPGAGRSA